MGHGIITRRGVPPLPSDLHIWTKYTSVAHTTPVWSLVSEGSSQFACTTDQIYPGNLYSYDSQHKFIAQGAAIWGTESIVGQIYLRRQTGETYAYQYERINEDNYLVGVKYYWGLTQNTTYTKGTFLDYTASKDANAYPVDGRNSADGYWYVKQQ